MTLNQLSRLLAKTNMFVRDVNAIQRGKGGKRIANRVIARTANRALRKAWRR